MASLDNYDLSSGETLSLDDLLVPLLGASTLDGTVQGPGTLALESPWTASLNGLVLDDGAIFRVNGAADQFGAVNLGTSSTDKASIVVEAGGTYAVLSDSTINANGTAAITNAGLFERGGTDGTATIDAAFSSSGTVKIALGTLDLSGASNSLGGTVNGAGTLNLEFGTTTLASGLQIAAGTFGVYNAGTKLTLEGNASDTGSFVLGGGTAVYLNGAVFTLGKTGQLGGTLIGSGTLLIDGVADANNVVLTGGATLQVAGTLTQDAFITLGTAAADRATITVSAGGTYALLSDASIDAQGTATLLNGGLFEKLGTDGTSTVDPAFVNQGTVDAAIGTIDFAAGLINNATITASAGATIIVAGGLAESTGQSGVFNIGNGATVMVDGRVDSHETFHFTGTSGTLVIGDAAAFGGTITGLQNGDTIDLAGIEVNTVSGSGDALQASYINQGGTVTAIYTLPASALPTGTPTLQTDNNGGTDIVFNHTGPSAYVPENIILDSWTAGSGNWDDGGNWLQVVPIPNPPYRENVYEPPNAGNDAQIEAGGGTPFTVSYDETDTVNQLTGSVQATLAMTGGTLTINQDSAWEGAFSNTGGTLDAVGGWNVYGSTTLSAGATDEVDSGIFGVGAGALAGKVIGDGTFELLGGNAFTIEKGFSATSVGFVLGVNGDGFGSDTTLDTNFSYTGSFVLADYTGNAATLTLNGTTLTLAGQSDLDGLITGAGGLTVNGTAEANLLTVQNGATLTLKGTLLQDGAVTIGTGTSPDAATLDISSTGTWDFVQNTAIAGYGDSAIDNAGLIEKTGGTGTSEMQGAFSNTGTVDVATGTLEFAGSGGTLRGTIEGAGTVQLGGGTYILASTLDLAASELALTGATSLILHESLSYGGTLSANIQFGTDTINLAGYTLDLTKSGSLATAYASLNFIGGGDFDVGARAAVTLNGVGFAGDVLLKNTGTLVAAGTIGLNENASTGTGVLLNARGATLSLAGTGTAIGTGGKALISNAGLIENTSGGTVDIDAPITNNGTITGTSGAIDLFGGGTLDNVLTGAGEIALEGNATYTLGSYLYLDTGTLAIYDYDDSTNVILRSNQSYAGTLNVFAEFGTDDFALVGHTLTLTKSGSLATASAAFKFIDGGELALTKSANVTLNGISFAGGTLLDNAGTLTAAGTIELDENGSANTGTLLNAYGGTLMLSAAGTAVSSGGTAALVSNSGVIENTSGGIVDIAAAINSYGEITDTTGIIEFSGGGRLADGFLDGAGEIALDGNGTYTFGHGVMLDIGTLAINATASFSNQRATIEGALSGDGTLLAATASTDVEVNGGSFGGDIAGAGFVSLDKATTLEAGASLSVHSLGSEANVTLASASVTNTAADYFSLGATLASTGTGAFTNLGEFFAAGGGTAQVSAPFTNSGYVDVQNGTLAFLSNVAGTGVMEVDPSSTLSLDLGAGSGQVVNFEGDGLLNLSNPLDFLGTITGFSGAEPIYGDYESDQIFLENTTYTTFGFSNNILTVKDNSTTVASLNITESSNSFTLTSENHGILITV